MERRTFLRETLSISAAASALRLGQAASAAKEKPAAADSLSLLQGAPVLTGPAAETLAILQAVRAPATGYAEIQRPGETWTRIDAESAGLLPYDQHVLKFRLPPLPAGAEIRYRVVAIPVDFKNAYKILPGEEVVSEEHVFRTLDPEAHETRFIVWNDTHENLDTVRALVGLTGKFAPDFLLWNGDQTNDVYDEAKMANQYLAPGGLVVASRWPLAYARGNHDVRGPAARELARFTGTPADRFYYAFRSGPLAALVLDTGEDKPDDHPVFGGLAGFAAMRERQTRWLAEAIRAPWFAAAPHKVLFCHIPLWWSDESDRGAWVYSKVCREAWLPLLKAAGVKLVVSGHTHEDKWLPAGAERPIGQLVGGGPKLAGATIIEGHATRSKLTLTMSRLGGEVRQTVEVTA